MLLVWGGIQILMGIAYSQILEWVLHNKVLHGKRAINGKLFSFHFHHHHAITRKNDGLDPMYKQSPFQRNGPSKELRALALLALPHIAVLPIVPFFIFGTYIGAIRYYYVHRKSHIDLEWAKENVPWHYDHHMGPNQHANWGVTGCWVDVLMGTRQPYYNTDKYHKDEIRRAARKERTRHRAATKSEHSPAGNPDISQPAADAS